MSAFRHSFLLSLAALLVGACSPSAAVITSFEECANAGYPVQESHPRRCTVPDGVTFTEEIDVPLGASSASKSEEIVRTYFYSDIGVRVKHPISMDRSFVNAGPRSTSAVRLSMWGPTQQPNTEFFDGVSVTISRERYSGTLINLAEEDMASILQLDGTITSELTPVSINGVEGVTFEGEGLGTFRHVYLPLENGIALHIISSSPDPTGQGFETQANAIISSIEIGR